MIGLHTLGRLIGHDHSAAERKFEWRGPTPAFKLT